LFWLLRALPAISTSTAEVYRLSSGKAGASGEGADVNLPVGVPVKADAAAAPCPSPCPGHSSRGNFPIKRSLKR